MWKFEQRWPMANFANASATSECHGELWEPWIPQPTLLENARRERMLHMQGEHLLTYNTCFIKHFHLFLNFVPNQKFFLVMFDLGSNRRVWRAANTIAPQHARKTCKMSGHATSCNRHCPLLSRLLLCLSSPCTPFTTIQDFPNCLYFFKCYCSAKLK